MEMVKYEQMHVIIFQDKSRVHLNDPDYKRFMTGMQSGTDGILLNGNYYRFSSVSKILTQAEFYAQYPQLTPPKVEKYQAPSTPKLDEERMRNGWIRALKAARQSNPNLTWKQMQAYMGKLIRKYKIQENEI
jgi:hypothetical protein